MLEKTVQREIPKYVSVIYWTGASLVALGIAGVAYARLAKPFSYGVVDNLFVEGTSYWIAGFFGLTTLSIAGVQYMKEAEKRIENK
jgi:hypothetical protein